MANYLHEVSGYSMETIRSLMKSFEITSLSFAANSFFDKKRMTAMTEFPDSDNWFEHTKRHSRINREEEEDSDQLHDLSEL